MTKEDAVRIRSGQVEDCDYPIYSGDLPKDLPEYVFNKLYEYVEYIRPGGDVWYARLIMERIREAIRGFNYVNGYTENGKYRISLDDCRIVYRIS